MTRTVAVPFGTGSSALSALTVIHREPLTSDAPGRDTLAPAES
ncbi:hypothetical protein SSCG_04833 [Streptomyces clavuligerus]|nr:hypothetical protein SSCG_04833 [Streptomyces clavuligerus]